MKHVVVTGVSTGIGRACAEKLAIDGFKVWGSVRSRADAEGLQQQLGDAFSSLVFDVTDQAAVQDAAKEMANEIGPDGLAGLVNNAGVAVAGPLKDLDLQELRDQFEINVVAALGVTQAFLPMLGAHLPKTQSPGRIVNISSVAGKRAMPFLGPYAMSKHALEAQSDSLRRELMLYGIDVIVVEPGAIKTPIWSKAAELDTSKYAGSDYKDILEGFQKAAVERGADGLPPSAIANVVCMALTAPSPKTRYVVLKKKFMNWTLQQFLPDRVIDRAAAKQLGFFE
jgi:hypothetical protein